jgi:chromosome segregation ATPase
MAIEISDFHELVVLLEQRPELRAQLRNLVLTEELLALPGIVSEIAETQRQMLRELADLRAVLAALVEAQARTDKRFEQLAAGQARTDKRFEELAQAQVHTEQRLAELAERQARTEQRIEELTQAQVHTEQRLAELAERQGILERRVEELTATVRELVQAQVHTEQRLAELAERQARTEQRIEELTQAQVHTEQRLAELAERQARTEQRIEELTQAQVHTEQRLAELAQRQGILERRVEELTATVRELVQAQVHTEQRLAELAERQARSEQRIEELTQAQVHTEQRLAELAQRQADMDGRLQQLTKDHLDLAKLVHELRGEFRGDRLERKYRENAPAYFGRIVRRARVVSKEDLDELLLEHEELSETERDQLLAADVVVRGQQWSDRTPAYLVVEVSVVVNPKDVLRARQRALILERITGVKAIPVVAGDRISARARKLAAEEGVWCVLNGAPSAPPTVSAPRSSS